MNNHISQFASAWTGLVSELRLLRKGVGLTPRKLAEAGKLRVAVAQQTGIESDNLSPHQIHAYLLYELEKLGDGIEAQATRNALAVGAASGPRTLMERRLDFSTRVNRHPDTIEAYENRGLEDLATRLASSNLNITRMGNHSDRVMADDDRRLQAGRNMVIQGLRDLYDLGDNAPAVLRWFGRGRQVYLNANVEGQFLPSSRGQEWFTFKLHYTFETTQDRYRIGVVRTAHDGEVLMASGLVDDILKLNADADYAVEVPNLLVGCGFVVHDDQVGSRELMQFKELDSAVRRELLTPVWQLEATACRILEVVMPESVRGRRTQYEYVWSLDLPTNGEHYAYWYAPSLMYLNNIIFDISRFPGRQNWQFFIQPFLGPAFPGALEPSGGDRYALAANSWVMQGHGIMLMWQPVDSQPA